MDGEHARPLSRTALGLLALAGLLAFAALIALGVWQVHRLSWKRELIAQVEHQLAAAPTPAPGPGDWTQIGMTDQYRRVELQGQYDHSRETCTQAVTRLGPGCWLMTPLHTDAGWWVLINRGFVETTQRAGTARPTGTLQVQGLLRLSEPGGGFLRRNDPVTGRWTSRDVAAIAQARGLPARATAPYFVDASNSVPGGPAAGLTVVSFRNHHLAYAVTWFGLAALLPLAAVMIVRRERALRASAPPVQNA